MRNQMKEEVKNSDDRRIADFSGASHIVLQKNDTVLTFQM